MTTAVGIMDREGWDHRTDILVVVNPNLRELLWVPRDLYCECLGNRINTAFKRGGHERLCEALGEHGIAVDHTICLLRSVVERAFEGYAITVPVTVAQEFGYPLSPQQPIEEGRKIVRFLPPEELLEGERFHHWIGARAPVVGESSDATGDLLRISRQQILLKRMLEEGFAFTDVSLTDAKVSASAALDDLRQVSAEWEFRTLTPLRPATIRKMHVFIREGA